MNGSSLRLRLLLWNVAVLALVLFGFLIVTHVAVRAYLLNSIDRRLEEMARRTARFVDRFDIDRPPAGASNGTRDRARPGESRERMEENRRQRLLRLFDMQGNPLPLFGRAPNPDDVPWDRAALAQALAGGVAYTFVEDGTTPLRVHTSPLTHDGRQIGVVQVVMSFEDARVLLDSLTLMLVLLVPCALVVAGASGLYLTHRTLRPIRQIAGTAETLNPDDLSQRLPVVGADEFAHLASTINGMLDRLEGAFTRLRESIAHERRFTADASHELRTPLTAIKANARLALKGERTPAQYREALQAIDQASESMHHLIQDLLLLARSDSGQSPLALQAVDPAALLRDAAALARTDDGLAPVEVAVAPGCGAIRGDPHHLQRLLINLLDNALRHTPADGRVTASAEERDGRVVVTVADTGEGIAPEHLPHLGERFYRVDAARAREHGGTGLGLAICHSIVAAHGGEMTIDSAPGAGTLVTISLPRMTEEPPLA